MSSWHKCEFPHRTRMALGSNRGGHSIIQPDDVTVEGKKTATRKNTCKLLLHKKTWQSLWRMITKRSDPSEQSRLSTGSFKNHENGSVTSTDRTTRCCQRVAQKKQPLLFRGYKCKQYSIWRPRGLEFFHWNAQITKEFPLIVPRYPWELYLEWQKAKSWIIKQVPLQTVY